MQRGMVEGLLVVLGLAVAGLQAYVRLAPIDPARFVAMPGPQAPGRYPETGGIKLVVPLDTLPPDALDRLIALAEATPRTHRVGSGTTPAAFVTRSLVWGFPDVATAWTADGNLHLWSHLVYGRGDSGVNARKLDHWLAELETVQQ
jgi:hypothetical protein